MPDAARSEWPDAAVESHDAVDRLLPGWPRPDDAPVPPTVPVPVGRGGDQNIPRPHNARPGGPAPWATLPPAARRPTVADVRAALSSLGPPRQSRRVLMDGPARPGRSSAVLAPIYDAAVHLDGVGAVGAHVVLTRRTWGLRTHRGEVSFPGGRVDPGESPSTGPSARPRRRSPSTPRSWRSSASSTISPLCPAEPRSSRSSASCPPARRLRPTRPRSRPSSTSRWPSCSIP